MLVAVERVGYSSRDRRWWFFLGLTVFALSIALGGNTPLYRLYYEVLPGTKRFRAPSLSFFIVAMSLVAMAAITLERLAALRDAAEATRRENGYLRKMLEETHDESD